MKHFALRKFLWNANGDGHTETQVNPGDEHDFGSATEGLLAEGYISTEAAAAPAEGDAGGEG